MEFFSSRSARLGDGILQGGYPQDEKSSHAVCDHLQSGTRECVCSAFEPGALGAGRKTRERPAMGVVDSRRRFCKGSGVSDRARGYGGAGQYWVALSRAESGVHGNAARGVGHAEWAARARSAAGGGCVLDANGNGAGFEEQARDSDATAGCGVHVPDSALGACSGGSGGEMAEKPGMTRTGIRDWEKARDCSLLLFVPARPG